MLRIFCLLSVALLVTLGAAPAKTYFTQWRKLQHQYNALAIQKGFSPIDIGVKQIWVPKRDIVDRCVTCHIGMGDGEPIPGHPVFGEHPEIPHEFAELGCVSCHQGQGRATTRDAAHGEGHHIEWDTPVVDKGMSQAGCGSCHASVKVPPTEVVERGAYLFDLHGCRSCHRVDGDGGKVGPDLSSVGLKGFDKDWHIRHLKNPGNLVKGSRMMNFGHLTDGEMDSIITYVNTLVGAPKLMAGKAVVNTHGCRGCHTIQGVGGDIGPPLDQEGAKSKNLFPFEGVEAKHTVANWHIAHLRNPSKVVVGSKMPAMGLNEKELAEVTTYLLSLRTEGQSLDLLPPREAVARLQKEKDHGTTGKDIYRVYCSACHGQGAEGKVLKELGTRVPFIGGSDFLAVASDNFLRANLMIGRPGRKMPAWGSKAGGLDAKEIDAVIGFLRSHEPTPPSFQEVQAANGDVDLGRFLFQGNCAMCHGRGGAGTVVAPSLINNEFLTAASDRFLYETIVKGRPGSAMPSHKRFKARQISSLMAFLDSHRSEPKKDLLGYRAAGSATYGKAIYAANCAACHQADGSGGVGPALANQAFLAAVSDGFLATTIREGRGNRAMRAFGKGRGGIVDLREREIEDLVTYIRTWQDPLSTKVLKGRAQGTIADGARDYKTMCAGCHGNDGKGGLAPALNNPGFLAAASDGFLQATILRGRAGTPMRAWGKAGIADLSPQQVNDIVAFIRNWDRKDNP
jgi:mono/diheme cytochrome c family protein